MTRQNFFRAMVALSALTFSGSAISQTLVEKQLDVSITSPLFVRVGQIEISDSEMDAYVRSIPTDDQAGFLRDLSRVTDLTRNLVTTEGLANMAVADGLLEEQEVQAQLYRQAANELAKMARDRYLQDVELDDYSALAREIWLTEPAKFKLPDTVDFLHILVSVAPNRTEVEAMLRVSDAYQALSDATDDAARAAVVSEYSDDEFSIDSGGLYEQVSYDELEGAMSVALESLPLNAVSDPIRTRFGWHLVIPLKRNEGTKQDWETARERAINIARERHLTRALERFLSDLQDAPIQFQEGAVRGLLDRFNVQTDVE